MEKIITEYQDYTITDTGEVFSYKKGKKKKMKLCPCTNRYLSVVLSMNGSHKRHLVHRLVALQFLDNKNNYREVNHIDGIITNNNLSNLEWMSSKMNMQHAVKNKLHKAAFGENAGLSKLTDNIVIELRKKYITGNYTTRQLASEYKMNNSAIWCAIIGKTWKHIKSIELLKQEHEPKSDN